MTMILVMAVICLISAAAIDFTAGIAYIQPASFAEIRQAFSDKDLSALVEGHQVVIHGSVTDNLFNAGLELGVEFHADTAFTPVPVGRVFAGITLRPFEYFAASADIGYQISLLDNHLFADDLIWRFAGEMTLEHVSVELFALLPVPTDAGFRAVLNLGNAIDNARLGLSGSYRF